MTASSLLKALLGKDVKAARKAAERCRMLQREAKKLTEKRKKVRLARRTAFNKRRAAPERARAPEQNADMLSWHFNAYSGLRCVSGIVEAPTYAKAMARAKKFLRALSTLLWKAKEKEFADCWLSMGFGEGSKITIVMDKEPT